MTVPSCHAGQHHLLKARRLGIDTYQEAVIYMRPVCRSEGFEAQARILVKLNGREVIATLNVVTSDLLAQGEAGLSEAAWRHLGAREGDTLSLAHTPYLESLGRVRAKVYGEHLEEADYRAIVRDVAAGRYADVQLASFMAACAGNRMDPGEILSLTRAMVATGERLDWGRTPVADKHCVGGLPGNRTTPIVVPIVAAWGLTIPKTSSRAITSPAGTADTMETLAPVDLDLPHMRRVVEREGGCIVWGGAVSLSPADDVLIRVERALDLDSEGQLVASVLSKKAAAGSTHVVIDIPVGPTAKVRTPEAARTLAGHLESVGGALGLAVRACHSDGSQPVGRGIGPALEARDVLAVLNNAPGAPVDLRDRSLDLAGILLELGGGLPAGAGRLQAEAILREGRAWRKFQAICEAQGGLREPPKAPHRHAVGAPHAGRVTFIDNRRLARVAKLAGAPGDPAAGLDLHVRLGERVAAGQPLFTVHADSPGGLDYALSFAQEGETILTLETEGVAAR